jgi:hypothetical protein
MKFGFFSILLRWLLVATVIFGTYNPSGRSFAHWALESDADLLLKLSVGLVLLALNLTFIQLTFRALGTIGVLLLAICLISIALTLIKLEFVSLYTWELLQLYIILFLTLALTIGVCWSAIRTRISGQVDSFDITRRI